MKKKPKLKEDEVWCEKCKKPVKKRDFNRFYNICNPCIDKSDGRGK